jgi:hypothetical protein
MFGDRVGKTRRIKMSLQRICGAGTFILVTLFLMLPIRSFAKNPLEMYPVPDDMYERKWCAEHKGATGVKMPDGTSAECITSTHVVEFEFAPKWAEAIGRALYYSFETGKKAGVVLIIDDEKSLEHWRRLNSTIEYFKLPIDTWKME